MAKKVRKHMSKEKQSIGAKDVGKVPVPVVAAAVAKPKVDPKMVVKGGMSFNGFRKDWYQLLQEYDGKTEAEFIEAATKTPPAKTKAGTAENPKGWLRFFKKAGAVQVGGGTGKGA